MVHALLEVWRVLEPGRSLLDLRPIHSNPPLEVVTAARRHLAGFVVDMTGGVDETAAGEAIAAVVRRGYFSLVGRDTFKFAAYWDTLPGLLAYADTKWRGRKYLSPDVLQRVRQLIGQAHGRSRLCVTNTIQLALYQKQDFPSAGWRPKRTSKSGRSNLQ
jgi:hypothetical protein